MNTNIAKTLDELKTIVMALHRSAGELDKMIQEIEVEAYEGNEEFLAIYIAQHRHYREASKERKGYSELDEMEADIWARLLADVHNKES